jgi:hypothetical protein
MGFVDSEGVPRLCSFPLLVTLGCALGCAPEATPAPLALVAVTFNTGTSEGVPFGDNEPGSYSEVEAGYSDLHYGDGLAWMEVVDDTVDFLADVQPDVIGFQEIFHPEECEGIPDEAKPGFICEAWQPGDPTVAQLVLGEGYQVACHLGKTDKCAAVKRSFGSFAGCGDDVCLDGLDGARVEGCGRGSRVGRGVVELVEGGTLTLVNVHASSGLAGEDQDCRALQFAQVFEDLGDGTGEPAANGGRNLVLGDFNTDPGRWYGGDPSADKILEHVGRDKPFEFISDVGEDAEPTYAGFFNIDHVVSDFADGDCWSAGVTEGRPAVSDVIYYDHKPVVCDVIERSESP